MAQTKEFFTRIQHKHDIEANWIKAVNFTPLNGEIVVYDKDTTHNYARIKIGDGETKINNLPFFDALVAIANFVEENSGQENNVELVNYTFSDLEAAYKEGKNVVLYYNDFFCSTVSRHLNGNLWFKCEWPGIINAQIHFSSANEKFGTLTNLTIYPEDINEEHEGKILKYNNGKAIWSNTVNADWNENDPLNNAYIKNRTHYLSEDIIFHDEALQKIGEGFPIFTDLDIVAGENYTVTINNDTFDLTAKYVVINYMGALTVSGVALGNIYLGDQTFPNTGEPFIFAKLDPDSASLLGCNSIVGYFNGDTEINFKIAKETYHTIDPNYIKDMFYSKPGYGYILSPIKLEIGFDGAYGVILDKELNINENDTYDFLINEVIYENCSFSFLNINDALNSNIEEFNVYGYISNPIEIGSSSSVVIYIPEIRFLYIPSTRDITFAIMGQNADVVAKKLDNKYLDLDWIPKFQYLLMAELTTSINDGINSCDTYVDRTVIEQDNFIIEVDGKKYSNLKKYEVSTMLMYLGNLALAKENFDIPGLDNPENTGENFFIRTANYMQAGRIYFPNDSVVHTVKIYTAQFEKIPELFLPELITIEDIDEICGADIVAVSEVKF